MIISAKELKVGGLYKIYYFQTDNLLIGGRKLKLTTYEPVSSAARNYWWLASVDKRTEILYEVGYPLLDPEKPILYLGSEIKTVFIFEQDPIIHMFYQFLVLNKVLWLSEQDLLLDGTKIEIVKEL